MALISQSEIDSFKSIFVQHFDIFANETLVVWKEPLKIVSSNPGNFYPGYGSGPTESISYQPVSGVFQAMIVKDNDAKWQFLNQTRNALTKGQIRIKVESGARDFINNGKNELFQIQDQNFNSISDDTDQNYFGVQYFYYVLERTN